MGTGKVVRVLAAALIAASAACGRAAEDREGSTGAAAPESGWTLSLEPLPLPATGSTTAPQLTVSDRGAILSWIEQTGNTAVLQFAERSGQRWAEPRRVAAGDDWFLSWADVPAVLRLRDGTLVANWYPATDPLIEAYDIRLSYSRDEGRTWAKPFSPHHDGTMTQHGFVSFFEMADGALGLIWLDGRDQELNTTSPEGGAMGLYFASFDRQWKQTAETAMDARVCECCPTATAVTSEGVVAAFRDRTPREIRDIDVTRLEGGTWSPARPIHVDGWEIDACPVNGPALSARGSDLAAAWFTAAGGQGRALASFSSDAGRTWSEPIRLDEGAPRGHVDVELLEDGSAVATWVEIADGRARFRLRRVEPSGARSAPIDVASGVRGYPRIARMGEDLLLAWTEGGDDGGDQIKGAVARLPRTTAP